MARRPRRKVKDDPSEDVRILAERIAECSMDGILAIDRERRFIFWNPAMEEMTGIPREQVLGRLEHELFPFLLETGDRERVDAALEGNCVTSPEQPFTIPQTGRGGYFEAYYAPLRDNQGTIIGVMKVIRDVTARRQAMNELEDSQRSFRALFEDAPVAYHEIDREGMIFRVNRAECELLGFPPEQILHRPAWDFVAPEEREASRTAIAQKIAGEQPLEPFRREFTRQDGVRLVLEIHENYIHDPGGRVIGIRSALLDVSAKQRAEQQLRRAHEDLEKRVEERTAELARANEDLQREVAERRRAEQRLALQFAAIRVLSESGTLEGAVPRILEAICRYLRLDLGIFWTVESHAATLRCHTVRALGEGGVPDLERIRLLALGREAGIPGVAWSQQSPLSVCQPLSTSLGEGVPAPGPPLTGVAFPVVAGEHVHGVVSVFGPADVSIEGALLNTLMLVGRQFGQFIERKAAEAALHESERRFAAFMDHLPGIAFMKDLEGRYVYVNAAVDPLLARQPAEFLGRSDAAILPPEVAAAALENDRRVLEGGKAVEGTEQWPRGGQMRTWLMYRFPVLDADGEPIFLGGVGVDVTDRTQLEDQLRHSQKMEAIGRLAGGVAHDFNNLLTIISGYARMILDQLGEGDRFRCGLEMILNASDRAAVLTSQLLAFSRRQVVQPRRLQLNHVVSNVEKMLRRVIGEHIHLSTSLDPELDQVKVDPGQVEQILMNLAVNSRDAMPGGGSLTIETANLLYRKQSAAATAEPERFVRLSVVDTGVGIDEQTRSRLFEPFFTTKGRGKGTGLGLSTVYGIVRQHGGEITVESAPGQGAGFHIYLPAAREPEKLKAEPAAAHSAAGGTETILLVEDEAGVRRLAREVLRNAGYRVLEAGDGPEALRIAEAEPGHIHLMVTDLIMPLMGGRELAERIAEVRKDTLILFMSGYTDDVIAYRGGLANGADLLQKPFTPDALARKVRQKLDEGERGAESEGAGRP